MQRGHRSCKIRRLLLYTLRHSETVSSSFLPFRRILWIILSRDHLQRNTPIEKARGEKFCPDKNFPSITARVAPSHALRRRVSRLSFVVSRLQAFFSINDPEIVSLPDWRWNFPWKICREREGAGIQYFRQEFCQIFHGFLIKRLYREINLERGPLLDSPSVLIARLVERFLLSRESTFTRVVASRSIKMDFDKNVKFYFQIRRRRGSSSCRERASRLEILLPPPR